MPSFTPAPLPELFDVKGLVAVVTGGGSGSFGGRRLLLVAYYGA
jgi:hypothetical protein